MGQMNLWVVLKNTAQRQGTFHMSYNFTHEIPNGGEEQEWQQLRKLMMYQSTTLGFMINGAKAAISSGAQC
jgi:hypothetical protein